jgi:hypothetical protein
MNEQGVLKPLPYPVYFVCKNTTVWSDVINGDVPPVIEQLHERFVNANDSWSTQPYIQLKQRGLDVHLVPQCIPGKICIVTYEDLAIKDFPFHSYVVACRHDRGRPEICEQRIVQNQLNVLDSTDHFLPHWPQPGLQPRDKSRGTKLENVAYKGRSGNLAEPFKNPDFLQKLRSLGINLSVSPKNHEERVRDSRDYKNVDVVLAVRPNFFSEYYLSLKPPSKLINAWLAGCPALLSPDPGFQSLRRSELDYIEVLSPDDVIAALVRLRDNPSLYSAMVENGFRRAEEFTPDRIALLWRDLLADPIAKGYNKWLSQSPIQKLIGRPTRFFLRTIKHKRERKHYEINIRNA